MSTCGGARRAHVTKFHPPTAQYTARVRPDRPVSPGGTGVGCAEGGVGSTCDCRILRSSLPGLGRGVALLLLFTLVSSSPASSPPAPSPSSFSPGLGLVTSFIQVTPGATPSDVSWDLSCSDGTYRSGGAPYEQRVTAQIGASCTLTMRDNGGYYGNGDDGWAGASWSGFGQVDIKLTSGSTAEHTFVVTHSPPTPPPSPPFSPGLGPLSSLVTVTSGTYPSEISWDLSCSDGTRRVGGAPFQERISVLVGSTCKLSMHDSHGDGWQGATWSGFGQADISFTSGSTAEHTFIISPIASSVILVTSGASPSEIWWDLSCSDGRYYYGGAPYEETATATVGASCTLTMYDGGGYYGYGDGWDGASWSGFGQVDITIPSGSIAKHTFIVPHPPPPSPSPPPSPPFSPDLGPISSVISVTSGTSPSEVSWELSCSDGTHRSGGAPYEETVTALIGASCTLTMRDNRGNRYGYSYNGYYGDYGPYGSFDHGSYGYYGDGWNGATWSGFGQVGITFTVGSTAEHTFVVTNSPPPSPPFSPGIGPVSSVVTMTSGTSPSEVWWDLSCSDGTHLAGGAPYEETATVLMGANCTLAMHDSGNYAYSDGWGGASWSGFGQVDITLTSGSTGEHTFVVMHSPPLPPPSPPFSPGFGPISSVVTVTSGFYPSEVSWDLSCSDGTHRSGGAPHEETVTALAGAMCTLAMLDGYGDGWDGASWSGFGHVGVTLTSGSTAELTFIVNPCGVMSAPQGGGLEASPIYSYGEALPLQHIAACISGCSAAVACTAAPPSQ